jgi:hypothetical protein
MLAIAAAAMEKSMRAETIESNWELIKRLEPFVKGKTDSCVKFDDAVRQALKNYMPALVPYAPEIIKYAALYCDFKGGDTLEVRCG